MTILGTSYFVSYAMACKYYALQGDDRQAVKRKIKEGEIHIGFPPVRPGDNIVIIDNGTRYAIQHPDKE